MKKFLKHSLVLLCIVILGSIFLDLTYTFILSSSNKRNKIEYVLHIKPQKYDVVIMGTSRANNHFIPSLFERKGYKTFNFGISGSHLFETNLLLKIMLQRKVKIKNLLLEADLSVCNEKRDEGTTARFMPYLHTNSIIKDHFKSEADFLQLYYIPFYRYIKFDSKIGFREVKNAFSKEKTNLLDNKGYYPLEGTNWRRMKNNIAGLKPIRNHYLDDIKEICRKNNIRLILVMTPMCKCTKGMNYFSNVNKIYPEIYNFENAVTEDYYFSSCGHLNNKGAIKFTNYILNHLTF
ncbi:hypothetical protein FLACOL_02642 [Flavobacterium columnare]|uniref:SGNH/GDSL hydrolase family protein n=2 Tax=Flavobacterium TaxID=237 RepID=A0ABW8PPN5_9FLAO|nr:MULTISPECIES: hypothetical protein [Flavobacterium]QYS88951.1 hypothetical protein JJC05_00170 [Flavobacterium davisii]SPE78626.1 hypothetical protein FLACOL_02642 [Flavobacterium columnare]